ncbi:MAG: DUF1499 domain-containing protein [Candidatus Scalindua sp.]
MLLVLGRLIYLSITSNAPETRLINGALRPCPGTPNCVSSEENESSRKVIPFSYTDSAQQAWSRLRSAIEASGGEIKVAEEAYIRATYTSRIFRFVDDMEFRLVTDGQVIHVRSGSRVGKSDLGVNRKNVEKVRLLFSNSKLYQ